MSINGLHVAILAGGISHERDVSLRSGRRVADALTRAGARVEVIDPGSDLLERLRASAPDVVWPVLHGASGEDGALYALLRASHLAYVGSKPGAARFAWNKASAKVLVKRAGIQTPESIVLPNSIFRELGSQTVLASIAEGLELPAVVKPLEGGSAQGVTFVDSFDGFAQALVTAFTYGDSVMIERRITGREIVVGVVDTGEGLRALPAVEIEPTSGVYDYSARYTAGETTFYAPARLDEATAARVEELALTAAATIGLRDIARIDLIVDEQGEPWFIEADSIPGLTETSLVPLGIEAAGLGLGDVYVGIASVAAKRGYEVYGTGPTSGPADAPDSAGVDTAGVDGAADESDA